MKYGLPNRIRKNRREYRYTIKELAEMLNISPSVCSRYEDGSVQPTMEVLCDMADLFNTTIDELYFDFKLQRRKERKDKENANPP
jgi:transcriptional regulator with XRE-family HTH domain